MSGLVKVVPTMGVKDVAGSLSAFLKGMEKGDEKVIGVIHGEANGISYRSNKFGEEPSKALTGVFEGVPSDPDAPMVQSSRLFLPASIQGVIIAAIENGIPADKRLKKAPPIGKGIDVPASISVPFKVMVGLRKTDTDGGGVGYEFVCAIPNEPKAEDALADSRAAARAMLEGPGAMKALALAAPDKPKAKGKSKAK